MDVIRSDQPGAYLVIAEDEAHAMPERFFTPIVNDDRDQSFDYQDAWVKVPAHWVVATNIALTAMSAADGLHVFARSLASADPLAGIKLSLLATGQRATITTREGEIRCLGEPFRRYRIRPRKEAPKPHLAQQTST